MNISLLLASSLMKFYIDLWISLQIYVFFFLRPKRYFSSKSFLAKSLLRFKFPKCDDNISALTHSHTVRIKYNILYLGCKFQVCIKLFQLGCSSNIISNTTYSFLLLKNRSVGQTIFIGKKMTIDYFSFISFHPSQRYASKSRYMSFFLLFKIWAFLYICSWKISFANRLPYLTMLSGKKNFLSLLKLKLNRVHWIHRYVGLWSHNSWWYTLCSFIGITKYTECVFSLSHN